MFSFVSDDVSIIHGFESSPRYFKGDGVYIDHRYEVFCLLSGALSFNLEGSSKTIKSGTIVFSKPGKLHFATMNNLAPYEYFAIRFNGSIIPSSLAARLNSKGSIFSTDQSIDEILATLEANKSNYKDEDMALYAKCKTIELVIALVNKDSGEFKNNKDGLIAQISEHVEKNLESDLSLESISDALNYSESYLSNAFKRAMRCPIMTYIRSKKIIYAEGLITQGMHPQEAARKCSFDHYSTFYRAYLKIFGTPPSTNARAKEF